MIINKILKHIRQRTLLSHISLIVRDRILAPLKENVRILGVLISHRVYISPKLEKNIVKEFRKLYFYSVFFGKSWGNTFWQGTPVAKCPLDLWIYQEIIFELKPDIIIECGTFKGGSALFLAQMCDLVNNGKVITIDITSKENKPYHKRIKYLLGSSTSTKIIKKIKSLEINKCKTIVILDSDHSKKHVLDELRIYSKFVTKGSYLIVEDTNVNGHPLHPKLYPQYSPGPMEAVCDFLKEDKDFIIDKTKEKLIMTFNPNGYLKKIK